MKAFATLLGFAGVGALNYGAWMASPWAGWVVGGLCAMMISKSIFEMLEEDGEESS
jgi:hypothetical protein